MLLLLELTLGTIRLLPRSRQALALENLALRQQLASLRAGRRRPRVPPVDRLFWVALREVWPDWRSVLAIVKPDTVVATLRVRPLRIVRLSVPTTTG
jgi:hypothetical protein